MWNIHTTAMHMSSKDVPAYVFCLLALPLTADGRFLLAAGCCSKWLVEAPPPPSSSCPPSSSSSRNSSNSTATGGGPEAPRPRVKTRVKVIGVRVGVWGMGWCMGYGVWGMEAPRTARGTGMAVLRWCRKPGVWGMTKCWPAGLLGVWGTRPRSTPAGAKQTLYRSLLPNSPRFAFHSFAAGDLPQLPL